MSEDGKLDSKSDKVRCFGVDEEGVRCKEKTGHPSGLCHLHRSRMEDLGGIAILKCSQCPYRDCPKKDEAPEGNCWFELYDENVRLETKEKLLEVQRRVMRSQYTLMKRMERLLTPNEIRDQESNLMKFYTTLSANLFNNLITHGRFMGYDVPSRSIKLEAKRVEILDKTLGDQKTIEEEKELERALGEAKVQIEGRAKKVD